MDCRIETINKQLTNVDDKIKLFNSDEMMGEQAFEKLHVTQHLH
jgi:chromosome segregation protein